MAQAGYTPISLYYSTTASAVPLAANLVPGELAINTNDGKLYYENSSGVVTLLAAASGASGDVVGPASATANGVALFDGTTGKLLQSPSTITYASSTLTLPSISASGNLAFTGTGNRITGDFGNATIANRLLFQNSVTNGSSTVQTIPNGTSTTSGFLGFNNSDPTNAAFVQISTAGGVEARLTSGITGTGTYLPITMFTSGSERLRIDTSGNVGIGTSSPAAKLQVNDTTSASATSLIRMIGQNSYQYDIQSLTTSGSVVGARLGFFVNSGSGEFSWSTSSAERMRIDSSGNVGIGTTTPSAQLQVTGSSSVSALKVPNIEEVATVSATAATGTINYDITTQSVLFYTSNASANWTVNFRGSSGTSLNTLMATGESMSVSFLVTQGATAYYNSAVQIDGSSVTPKWQGGSAPTSGNASSIDSYTYVIIKTGAATFTVLATQTKFA
jgi:hypothetical protein